MQDLGPKTRNTVTFLTWDMHFFQKHAFLKSSGQGTKGPGPGLARARARLHGPGPGLPRARPGRARPGLARPGPVRAAAGPGPGAHALLVS